MDMRKLLLSLILILSTITMAQIALPSFHGVQKYHPSPNYAHSFDGVDDIISCGDITNLRRPGYFTVMFWFKRTQDNSVTIYYSNHKTNNIMYSKGSDPNNDTWVSQGVGSL